MWKKIYEELRKFLRLDERGFTPVELMVVVIILVLLASIVVPKVTASIT